jgi:hypothetical protein
VVREEEVDLARVVVDVGDRHVAVGPGQAGTAAEGAEAALQLTAGERGVFGGRSSQRPGARAAVEHLLDRAVVVELVAHCLADGVLEVVGRAWLAGEVEEGSGDWW